MYWKFGQRRLAEALEWPAVDKGLLLMLSVIPLYMQSLLWAAYVHSRPDRDRLIHVEVSRQAMMLHACLIVLGSAIALFGFWLRKRRPDYLPFQHAVIQFYAVSLVLISYPIGTLSFCVGVVLLGTPIFGFILLDRIAVWGATALALLLLAGLNYAAVIGWIPYAPVVVPPVDAASRLFWMNSTLFFAAPFLIFVTFAADQLLIGWRLRESRIRELSRTDVLTGLHNRRSILELLDQAIASAARRQAPLGVVLLDLDHFKRINDTWGHPVGDRVLQVTAACLRAEVRQGDLIGRYGGEEFLVLLPGADADAAVAVMERCRQALMDARIQADNGEPVPISASFGVVIGITGGCQPAAGALIQAADAALYQAKAEGRNQVRLAA